jgi:hypothetical protein
MTGKQLLEVVSDIYRAPLGVFPRWGLGASMKVSISSAPNSITLTNEHSENATLSSEEGGFRVYPCPLFKTEAQSFEELSEAVLFLLSLFLKSEVMRKVGNAHK